MSARRRATLIVIAKAPVPGRSKTRLCPPCTFGEAADIAQAALADTLDAVASAGAQRTVLVLAGTPGPWLPDGIEVVPQASGDLADRLAGAFESVGGPALLVGMDTPQLTPEMLRRALALVERPEVDAVLGPAYDGGYWAIGLRRPDPAVFEGVPMSVAETCAAQRRRLRALGLRWRELAHLRDVDTIADARAVSAQAPGSRTARVVGAIDARAPVAVGALA